jgi:hypothetical protein
MTREPISGVMPRWQKNLHRFSFGLLFLVIGGFALVNLHFVPLLRGAGAAKGAMLIMLWMVLIAAIGIGTQLWFWRRMVSDFSYDGSALRFRTLGRPEMETRYLMEITNICDWRARGSRMGYRLTFRDKQKIYLQYSVSNSAEVAELIRRDLAVP